jgi:hypothetical protein
MRLVDSIEDVIAADMKKPGMVFDENSRWVRFVSRRVSYGVETRSGREKHSE